MSGSPGRRCAVCRHPEPAAIDAALTTPGVTVRDVGARYGIAKSVVHTHRTGHLPLDLARAAAEAGADDAETILRRMRVLEDRAVRIMDRAEATGDARTAILALREARQALELLGRNLGLFATQRVEVRPAVPDFSVFVTALWELQAPVLVEASPTLPDGRDPSR